MQIKSIAKNTSYFTLALVLQKVISFTYFLILARNLVPEDLGKYYFAISLTTMFAIFIDIGLSNVLVREVAKSSDEENSKLEIRNSKQYIKYQISNTKPRKFASLTRGRQAPNNKHQITNNNQIPNSNSQTASYQLPATDYNNSAQRLLSTVLAIKLPLALLSLAAVFIFINVTGYPELTRHLVYIASIAMVLDSFTLSFYGVARGLHNLAYESVGVVLFQLFVLGLGVAALKSGLALTWIIAAVAAASFINFSFSASVVRWKYGIKLKPQFDKQFIKLLLAITVPFALFAIFQRVYMYQDTVLLSMLAGDKYVGLYQVAFKIIFALQFLPMAFVASLYPALSKYWKSNREQLGITFERALRYLFIIALPISAGVIALADRIIQLFKPEYMAAVIPLQITIIALVFIFLNFPIGSLLNACDRQKINTRNMAIALVSSIALNLILIPLFQKQFGNGAIGAGITVVFTNFLMFALGLYYVPQILDWSQSRRRMFGVVWRVLLAIAAMSAAVLYLKTALNVFAVIAIGAVVYGGVMYTVGGIRKEDVVSVKEALRR